MVTDYFGLLSGGGVVVVVELLLPGVVVVLLPGVIVVLLPGVIVVLLPVDVEESGVVVVVPMEPLAPGVPVVLLLPIPVVVSVVPLDGLVVWSVVLSVVERGLVVDELLPRGVAGPERPSGGRLRPVELSLPTPVPLLGEVVLVLPWSPVVPVVELPTLPLVPAVLWSVPSVPLVVLLVPVPVWSVLVPAVPVVPVWPVCPVCPVCGDATVPCAPAEVPLDPVVCPSAATAAPRTKVARNVVSFSLMIILASDVCEPRKLRTPRPGGNRDSGSSPPRPRPLAGRESRRPRSVGQ